MHRHINVVLNSIVLSFACMGSAAHTEVIQTEAKPSSEATAASRSQHPNTHRIGPNPLIPVRQN